MDRRIFGTVLFAVEKEMKKDYKHILSRNINQFYIVKAVLNRTFKFESFLLKKNIVHVG